MALLIARENHHLYTKVVNGALLTMWQNGHVVIGYLTPNRKTTKIDAIAEGIGLTMVLKFAELYHLVNYVLICRW